MTEGGLRLELYMKVLPRLLASWGGVPTRRKVPGDILIIVSRSEWFDAVTLMTERDGDGFHKPSQTAELPKNN
jgi:hypothetical protein